MDDPVYTDFYEALACRDAYLRAKNTRGGRSATGTRRLIENRGRDIHRCLIEMADTNGPSQTFLEMVSAGHAECTAEYIIAMHPQRFAPDLVDRVRARLREHGVEL